MKQFKKSIVLLILLCMGAVGAYAQSNRGTLSASTVFRPLNGDGEASWPKAKIGASLKKSGFTLESETQKEGYSLGVQETLHTKVYKKGNCSVEYTFFWYGENPFFTSLKIKFPTIEACEKFYKEVVKRVEADWDYWHDVNTPIWGTFPGEWTYKKNKCERTCFGEGAASNQFWKCEGKTFTYTYKEIPIEGL